MNNEIVYPTMAEAVAYILRCTGSAELHYKSEYYSCGMSETMKIHATREKGKVVVTTENWPKDRDPDEPLHEMERKEICKLAFLKLRNDDQIEAAMRMAWHLIDDTQISLGFSDTDNEIERALKYCGAEPHVKESNLWAVVNFTGTVKVSDPVYRKLKAEFYD